MARTKKAKVSVNGLWHKFLTDEKIDVQLKIEIYKSAVRGMLCYAGQVFGYTYQELINKLQLYFLKFVLKLPVFTPTYAIFLETQEEPTHLYMLKLHMNFIYKTLFVYGEHRLPHQLSLKIIERKVFWYKEWCNQQSISLVRWEMIPLNKDRWRYCIKATIENCSITHTRNCIALKEASLNRIYKKLRTHDINYHQLKMQSSDLMYIAKARIDLLGLNHNRFGENLVRTCNLCNMNVLENMHHFMGVCPTLSNIRKSHFKKSNIAENEVVAILNGEQFTWATLASYIRIATQFQN